MNYEKVKLFYSHEKCDDTYSKLPIRIRRKHDSIYQNIFKSLFENIES